MGIGFGIVGLGMIADFHARALHAATGATLVACASRSAAKEQEFAARHGCAGYHDLQQFLRHPGLEVVAIATPSGAHLEPALAAIEAGKHLIVEKPLEVTGERCARLLEAAARRGVVVAGIFPSRFLEVSRLIKQAIDGGRLGRVVLGDAYIKWFRNQQYYDEGGWHGTRRLDGGGALMNQSIHAIDLLQWFMGPVERVLGASATLGHRDIEVEDTAAAVVQFANGALGTIEGQHRGLSRVSQAGRDLRHRRQRGVGAGPAGDLDLRRGTGGGRRHPHRVGPGGGQWRRRLQPGGHRHRGPSGAVRGSGAGAGRRPLTRHRRCRSMQGGAPDPGDLRECGPRPAGGTDAGRLPLTRAERELPPAPESPGVSRGLIVRHIAVETRGTSFDATRGY